MRRTLKFTEREARLIGSKDVLALSTVSQDGWPHSVPVSYLYLEGKFYIPASPKSQKIRNLRQNHRATVMIDVVETESGLMMECDPEVLTGGKSKKFMDHMRKVKRWQTDETTVIIVLKPVRKASWFLKE